MKARLSCITQGLESDARRSHKVLEPPEVLGGGTDLSGNLTV